MAYVNTDATYYSPNATSVDVTASCTPYNPANHAKAMVMLIHKTSGSAIVADTVVQTNTKATLTDSLGILPSDPRGTYYVLIVWYNFDNDPVLTAQSKDIF
ncbi:hypothetical protein [Sporolactobacillus inulinus]|nr:hypothetical protein [Sporolactobacillus inulinus]